MDQTRFTPTWEGETRRLSDLLARLSFRDAAGAEIPISDAFRQWNDHAVRIRKSRRVCYLIGNGACATLASHFSADLAKNGRIHTQVFSDPALLTATSNDCGYEEVFAEPLSHMAVPGDLLVAISSSGRSPNILRAAEAARRLGMTVVTLSAMDEDNPLRGAGDLNAYVPAAAYGHSETCHAAVLHYWMDRVAETIPHHPRTLTGSDPKGDLIGVRPREGRAAISQPVRFDRSRLTVRPLSEREHDLDLSAIAPLAPVAGSDAALTAVAGRMRVARRHGSAVLLMAGAHLVRAGVQRYLIDLMERGYLSGVALNGGGMIHDFELALAGATTESVARYVADGRFGLWRESGRINDIVTAAARTGQGLGAAIGEAILAGDYPHKDISILAAGVRLGIPVTVHIGIGYDIVHEHPNCDGAAYGQTSYADFLTFASLVERLEGGVVMNFGSAVMAPEVFLKALAMARNVATQEGRRIDAFTTLVTDLRDLPEGAATSLAHKTPDYYFRPLKTMLVRAVATGGESYYVKGHHAQTFPALWTEVGREGTG
jgi:phosphoheptose isomerase